MIVYGAASLLHFVHNAVYIREYPNLPKWITALGVYASWFAIAAVGALGYWLYRKVSQKFGLVVIAPFGAHSIAMNATIIAEVSAASALLIYLTHSLLTHRKQTGP